MMLKAAGKVVVADGMVRIVLHADFCRFYRWLFNRAHYFTLTTQIPMHGAHINIVSHKIHKGVDISKVASFHGKRAVFAYDPAGNYGGFTKGFQNFWLDVGECSVATQIADILDLPPAQPGFSRWHITVLNTKNL